MRMINCRTVLALALIVGGAAACSGESPTSTEVLPAARLNGGITLGSGNFTGTGYAENTTAADSVSAARGGITFGSGN